MCETLPKNFVYLDEIVPDIILDIKYATKDNFTQNVIDGYKKAKCILTHKAALALSKVQTELKTNHGFRLKIFDGYRPQKAVQYFIDWTHTPDIRSAKVKYYPNITKRRLIEDGYITKLSDHSRGSTIDLTIVNSEGKDLDMGTEFDVFDPKSHTNSTEISNVAQNNRKLLKNIMKKHDFINIPIEWWHYKLMYETYRRTPLDHFDFDVE